MIRLYRGKLWYIRKCRLYTTENKEVWAIPINTRDISSTTIFCLNVSRSLEALSCLKRSDRSWGETQVCLRSSKSSVVTRSGVWGPLCWFARLCLPEHDKELLAYANLNITKNCSPTYLHPNMTKNCSPKQLTRTWQKIARLCTFTRTWQRMLIL